MASPFPCYLENRECQVEENPDSKKTKKQKINFFIYFNSNTEDICVDNEYLILSDSYRKMWIKSYLH